MSGDNQGSFGPNGTPGTPTAPQQNSAFPIATGNVPTWNGTTWVPAAPSGGAPSGSAGGDLTGTYPNPQVNTVLNGQTPVVTNNFQWTTWTPTFNVNTPSTIVARYLKIGTWCTFHCAFTWAATQAGATGITFTLPVFTAPAQSTQIFTAQATNNAVNSFAVTSGVGANSATVGLDTLAAGGASATLISLTGAAITSGGSYLISGSYETA